MDTVEFLKEAIRMCKSYTSCTGCVLEHKCPTTSMETEASDKLVEIIEKWSKEHPIKTRQDKFLEQYPDTLVDAQKMLSSIGGCDATEEWERGWDEAIDTALNELRKVKAADRWIQPILEGLENIAKKHPYKVIGNMDSYSQYNEAWQDCIDCVERMISEVFIEHQLQKDAINTIERQPKVGEWIPCSEMLPENSKHVKISKNTDIVTAWQPEPEPWEEE